MAYVWSFCCFLFSFLSSSPFLLYSVVPFCFSLLVWLVLINGLRKYGWVEHTENEDIDKNIESLKGKEIFICLRSYLLPLIFHEIRTVPQRRDLQRERNNAVVFMSNVYELNKRSNIKGTKKKSLQKRN